ncbi:MAG: Gx transporter family protein [Clostridiaceae bacterium]|nr:Gx transporter family protein [Clostridiaceae bacterium]
MVLFAVMTAVAIILHFVEGLFPMPVAIPGIKLGLPNIVSIVALYLFGPYAAFVILILRVFITSFLYSGFSSLIFSLTGGLLSVMVMSLFWKFREKGFSIISASVAGGVFHNVGQIFAAVAVLRTSAVFSYLPVLIVAGVATGTITGIVSGIIVPRLSRIYHINK